MMHRKPTALTRRDALRQLGAGFGSLGLASVLSQSGMLTNTAEAGLVEPSSPLAPKPPHFAPKAKNIIQLFMPGGPSQVDTFDYKQPSLLKNAGERPKIVDRKTLRNTKMGLMPSPYSFKQHGQTGKWVSEIFPYTAQMVRLSCVRRSA